MCGLFGFSDPKHTLTQKQIRRLTGSLATASEQQSAASEEINRSIDQVSGMAADTAQSMAEAREEMDRLVELTGTLEALMARLKE